MNDRLELIGRRVDDAKHRRVPVLGRVNSQTDKSEEKATLFLDDMGRPGKKQRGGWRGAKKKGVVTTRAMQ